MQVKQISIFLENKSGRLAEVTKLLGDNKIDISALSIADKTDYGILRLIVNKPEEAEKVLKEKDFAVSITTVIAIAVADRPGGLSEALSVLRDANIGIEYMYAFVGKASNEAMVILRVDDPDVDEAVSLLVKSGIKVLPPDFIYNL